MRSAKKALQLAAGGVLFALALYGILSIPGLVTDNASTVPLRMTQGAAR